MEERIAALEARIRELELAPRRPMRESLRCPMCGGTRICRSTSPVGDRILMNLGRKRSVFGIATTPCTAHACTDCGFIELHAVFDTPIQNTDLEVLSSDAEAPPSPYR